mmetsp:Transcript_23269/g.29709  ORF Transcript_23269/g.29709 Transcript_23269/m.29709 type:complete len:297 (+) Transcript_23269:46-936(+)
MKEMMEVSVSMLAWLAVVVLQAIIHFGFIGPRSRKWKKQENGDVQIEMEMSANAADEPLQPQAEIVDGFQNFSSEGVSEEYSSHSTQSGKEFLSSSSKQQGRIQEDPTDQICTKDERDTCEDVTPITSLLSQKENHTRIIGTRSNKKYCSATSASINCDDPAFDENGYDTDDCIDGEEFTGNEYDNEDERYRYELVRRYYSCPSIVPHVEPRRRYERCLSPDDSSLIEDTGRSDSEKSVVLKSRNYELNGQVHGGLIHRGTKKHVAFSTDSEEERRHSISSLPFSMNSIGMQIQCA